MDVFWTIFLFMLGACIGSFLNVVIYRLPRGQSIVFPGSHCPNCGRGIRWYDNIPLLSWLALRARCRFCKAPISPRYILIELATAVLVAGLYVCYYVLDIRDGAGLFSQSWPMYAAHAALLCGLLACTAVDLELWIVPLEVCWFVSIVGAVAATAAPHPWLPSISPTVGAMAVLAGCGLIVSLVLTRYGLIQRSFIDASDKPLIPAGKQAPSVAFTSQDGVKCRLEILREVIFLAPPLTGAILGYLVVTHVPVADEFWRGLLSADTSPLVSPHMNGFLSALLGYLVGGLWIWGIRVFGTLAFGKEAMGLGDVHILAAVGAVMGWIAPSVVFFVAPLFGVLWAVYLWLGRNQRELPYGPWLAAASLIVMLFYDGIVGFLSPYNELYHAACGH